VWFAWLRRGDQRISLTAAVMVNLLETLYAITALALLTVLYYGIRGRQTDTARERFKGALWVSLIGVLACASLYWYLS
jgi:hypothetical protein